MGRVTYRHRASVRAGNAETAKPAAAPVRPLDAKRQLSVAHHCKTERITYDRLVNLDAGSLSGYGDSIVGTFVIIVDDFSDFYNLICGY